MNKRYPVRGLMGAFLLSVLVAFGGVGLQYVRADGMPGAAPATPNDSGSDAAPRVNTEANTRAESYTRAMEIGYAAAEARDYHTALINFRRALEARPGDRYALAAIANMESYIAQQRAEAAKRQRAMDLQSLLTRAVNVRDWACAAASLDELITLVPPNSLDRAQLVTYRGEVAGFLEARDTVENWSGVCPG